MGLADFLEAKLADGVKPGECLIMVPRKAIGYVIRDRLEAQEIPVTTHFREEAISNDKALEALTLLTLLADPEDRLAPPRMALDRSRR